MNLINTVNLFGINFYVQNRNEFRFYRLNYPIFPTLGVYLKFSLYRIPVYSGFGLDRFYCIFNRDYNKILLWRHLR